MTASLDAFLFLSIIKDFLLTTARGFIIYIIHYYTTPTPPWQPLPQKFSECDKNACQPAPLLL